MISSIFYRFPSDKQRLQINLFRITKRSIVNLSSDRFIHQCYSILELDSTCRDQTMIRKAYLEKVKQYHPDSSLHENKNNHEKFHQIQQAYETLIELVKSTTNSSNQSSIDDDIHMKFDIRHRAPQHRTHLEYGGFGIGTPSQRQTAYYKMRAEQAYERVNEYRRDRESVETREELVERKKRKDIRATNFVDRLVEDLIQESISRGDFNNIRPSSKPLHERNPHYMDFTTYKINEILIDNGYTPEWILLEKQVRESINEARINLKRVLKNLATDKNQSSEELKIYLSTNIKWTNALEKFRSEITEINVNINKLNLIVPMLWRQQIHYNAEREIAKILELNPWQLDLPPSEEELALINRKDMEQRHQQWETYQANQRYSIGDAIRDFFQAFRNFKV